MTGTGTEAGAGSQDRCVGRRIALRIAAVAVVITAVAVPTAAVVNRSRFGTFAFWELPIASITAAVATTPMPTAGPHLA